MEKRMKTGMMQGLLGVDSRYGKRKSEPSIL